jgi:hypothetical protein
MGAVRRLAGLEPRGIADTSSLPKFPSPFLILCLACGRHGIIGIEPSPSFQICVRWRLRAEVLLGFGIGKGGGVSAGRKLSGQLQHQGHRPCEFEVKDNTATAVVFRIWR